MNQLNFVVLALAATSFSATAADQGLFYVAGGASKGGGNFSIGIGSNADVLEISSIKLGAVDGASHARFAGLSLVQNAAPIKDFNLLFRLGIGKATTTFADGSSASRTGFNNGVFFGIGGQYQLNSHLAFRGELDRITYVASTNGSSSGVAYPMTISALYIF